MVEIRQFIKTETKTKNPRQTTQTKTHAKKWKFAHIWEKGKVNLYFLSASDIQTLPGKQGLRVDLLEGTHCWITNTQPFPFLSPLAFLSELKSHGMEYHFGQLGWLCSLPGYFPLPAPWYHWDGKSEGLRWCVITTLPIHYQCEAWHCGGKMNSVSVRPSTGPWAVVSGVSLPLTPIHYLLSPLVKPVHLLQTATTVRAHLWQERLLLSLLARGPQHSLLTMPSTKSFTISIFQWQKQLHKQDRPDPQFTLEHIPSTSCILELLWTPAYQLPL